MYEQYTSVCCCFTRPYDVSGRLYYMSLLTCTSIMNKVRFMDVCVCVCVRACVCVNHATI